MDCKNSCTSPPYSEPHNVACTTKKYRAREGRGSGRRRAPVCVRGVCVWCVYVCVWGGASHRRTHAGEGGAGWPQVGGRLHTKGVAYTLA